MLTRDISVEDCILDLLDNAVDSAWKQLGKKPLTIMGGPDFSNIRIDLKFDANSFRIADNCGGMSLESAKNYAFTFGRSEPDPEDTGEFSIGVYGIGLKRAVFKIGTMIAITSTYGKGRTKEAFVVPINAKTWVKGTSRDWDFPIESAPTLPESGLKIEVTGLTPLAEVTFGDPEFEPNLKRTIARDYALHFNKGLKVFVNGERVRGEEFKLYESNEFTPQFAEWRETVDGKVINVQIVAGFAFPPPADNNPTDRGEREDKSGWYVACNGRIVMAADKSYYSVWGDDFPLWHPQYTGFFGLIMFTTDHTELLPLTTTKRNVDLSSLVYRRARPRMKESTRAWITYTNNRKSDQLAAEEAERNAQRTSIFAVKPQPKFELPTIKKSRQRESSIQFSMLKERITVLAKAFGNINMSNREVGVKAFEYAYEDLVEE